MSHQMQAIGMQPVDNLIVKDSRMTFSPIFDGRLGVWRVGSLLAFCLEKAT